MEPFYGAETVAALAVLREMDAIVDATHTLILKPAARAYALGCEALG
jgi:hypothetical protein